MLIPVFNIIRFASYTLLFSMRSADLITSLRILFLFVVLYAVAVKINAVAAVLLIITLFLSDSLDGYMAALGEHSPVDFGKYLLDEAKGNRKKRFPRHMPSYAAYFDIAVDRLVEYGFWLLFTLLSILPWFIFVIVFARNTLSDFLVLRRGKSFSSMHTGFGRIASSHFSRGLYGALKALAFIYLALVFIAGLPLAVGYALAAMVVAFSLLRGAAEIYEALV